MALGNRVHIIMAVWGRSYQDLFLDVSLPSQLSANNLPGIAGDGEITYKIYTMKGDEEYIQNHPAFEKLQRLVQTQIIAVDQGSQEDKFSPLMGFHNRAIEEADRENAALIFLSPDFVLADGALSKVMSLKNEGFRAVMALTLRMVRETGTKELCERFYSPGDHTITASPREMVEVGMRHLHPIERSYFWGPCLCSFPIHAYWPVRDEGLVARCFYLHPLMINPVIRFVLPKITIDADYIDRAVPGRPRIHVVRDSDELTCFELSSSAMGDANAAIRPAFCPTAWNYAKWAVVNANPAYESLLHHWLFQLPIRVHSRSLSSSWEGVEEASEKLARKVRLGSLVLRSRGKIGEAVIFRYDTAPQEGEQAERPLPAEASDGENATEEVCTLSSEEHVGDAEGLDLRLYASRGKDFSGDYRHALRNWLKGSGAFGRKDVDRMFERCFLEAHIPGKKRMEVDLAGDFWGTGWGQAESNVHGQKWRWIGPDGTARMFLSLKPRGQYVLKTKVHTAPGETLYDLSVSVDGRPAMGQRIVKEKDGIWHWCVLPEPAIGIRGGKVEIAYQLGTTRKNARIALSRVVCSRLKKGIGKAALSKAVCWLAGVVDLGEDVPGAGWGEADFDENCVFRWLGNTGKSSLFLPLFAVSDYSLKTLIFAKSEDMAPRLKVEVNGEPAARQQVLNMGNQQWHTCIITREAVSRREGKTEVLYRLDKKRNEERMALRRVVYRVTFRTSSESLP